MYIHKNSRGSVPNSKKKNKAAAWESESLTRDRFGFNFSLFSYFIYVVNCCVIV